MAAGKYNFLVEQGSQHEVTFRYKLSDGSYQNLDNYRVRMSVKNHLTDTDFVYQASTSSTDDAGHSQHFSIVTPQSDAENRGKFVLTIPTSVTTDFDFNQGVYDLELVEGEVVTRLLEGKFRVSPQVSV